MTPLIKMWLRYHELKWLVASERVPQRACSKSENSRRTRRDANLRARHYFETRNQCSTIISIRGQTANSIFQAELEQLYS